MLRIGPVTAAFVRGLMCIAVLGGTGPPAAAQGGRDSLSRKDLALFPLDNASRPLPEPRYPKMGCKTLRTKMQISDGFCTSIKPVKSILCTGNCLPEADLPWYAPFVKYWSKSKLLEYTCEDDVTRRKKVDLVCENGETRRISVKVVRSCKCVRRSPDRNRPLSADKYYSSHSAPDREEEVAEEYGREDYRDTNNNRDRLNKKNRRRKNRKKGRRKTNRNRKKEKRKSSGDSAGQSRAPSEL